LQEKSIKPARKRIYNLILLILMMFSYLFINPVSDQYRLNF
jgi:hypothetical protein